MVFFFLTYFFSFLKVPRNRLNTDFIKYMDEDIKKTNVIVYNPATSADILHCLTLTHKLKSYSILSFLGFSSFYNLRNAIEPKKRVSTVIISIMTNILTPLTILFLLSISFLCLFALLYWRISSTMKSMIMLPIMT